MLRVLHNPRYTGAFTCGRHRHLILPRRKRATTMLPRSEWISFIPGAHPGYITLDQYDANLGPLKSSSRWSRISLLTDAMYRVPA